MCVTVTTVRLSFCPLGRLSAPQCVCLYSKFHALAFVWPTVRIRFMCVSSSVAKNYCTFAAFVLLAVCLFGFLLLVVSIYGKLLKLYGNLFASLCVCVVHLVSLRAFSVVIVFPLSAGFLFFY